MFCYNTHFVDFIISEIFSKNGCADFGAWKKALTVIAKALFLSAVYSVYIACVEILY